MIKKINSKGDITSDMFYFLVGVFLVAIGLFLMFSISNNEKKNNLQEIAGLKEGYQTIQLARTFIQTPLEFKGETKLVAEWVNDYFLLTDPNEKANLRFVIFDLAELTIKPHLRNGYFDSEATFTYYILGNEYSQLTVASTWATDEKSDDTGIIYSGIFQEDVSIQLPVYIPGAQFNPSDRYILFEIKTSDEMHDDSSIITFRGGR